MRRLFIFVVHFFIVRRSQSPAIVTYFCHMDWGWAVVAPGGEDSVPESGLRHEPESIRGEKLPELRGPLSAGWSSVSKANAVSSLQRSRRQEEKGSPVLIKSSEYPLPPSSDMAMMSKGALNGLRRWLGLQHAADEEGRKEDLLNTFDGGRQRD